MTEEMRWIPVSERLPEEGQEAPVTIWEYWSYGKGTDIQTAVDTAIFRKGWGYIGFLGTWIDEPGMRPYKVTAWIPLPMPYQETKESQGRTI